MTTRQAAAVYRELRKHGYDAWAGQATIGEHTQAIVEINRRAGPMHTADFQFLLQLCRERDLDLSWGTVQRAVLVLS